MRFTKRYLALAVAGLLLAACGHKDKDAPLAYVPADTPYVFANLDVLDDDTRKAVLAQADGQLQAQVEQMKSVATDLAEKDADSARLLQAFITELDGKTIETFAQNAGLNIKGRSALYGLGLSPVARFEVTDAKAFDAFVGRLENAYGKPLESAQVDGQAYRKHVTAETGTQVILATVGKQAVAAILPADADKTMLRLALGLDRPAKNIQDDERLEKIAKDKGYKPWVVGQIDLARALPLAASGKDPFFLALFKAHAQDESRKTGEPVANQLDIPPACESEAARIASRVPSASFGYTRLDATHQDLRWDIALAPDITKAFADVKVALPGLGGKADAPFDAALALPMSVLRPLMSEQAQAVEAKPFSCPAFTDLNDGFARIAEATQQAAMPPFGDLVGLRISLDTYEASEQDSMPRFTGRMLVGSTNPAALLAMGKMASPLLAQLKLTADGKPAALPADATAALGQPIALAMNDKGIAAAVGQGEDAKLTDMLQAPVGDAGALARIHLNGDMYLSWVKTMQQRAEAMFALGGMDQGDDDNDQEAAQKRAMDRAKLQFEAMRQQVERIKSIDGDARMEDAGLVITSRTELK